MRMGYFFRVFRSKDQLIVCTWSIVFAWFACTSSRTQSFIAPVLAADCWDSSLAGASAVDDWSSWGLRALNGWHKGLSNIGQQHRPAKVTGGGDKQHNNVNPWSFVTKLLTFNAALLDSGTLSSSTSHPDPTKSSLVFLSFFDNPKTHGRTIQLYHLIGQSPSNHWHRYQTLWLGSSGRWFCADWVKVGNLSGMTRHEETPILRHLKLRTSWISSIPFLVSFWGLK